MYNLSNFQRNANENTFLLIKVAEMQDYVCPLLMKMQRKEHTCRLQWNAN